MCSTSNQPYPRVWYSPGEKPRNTPLSHGNVNTLGDQRFNPTSRELALEFARRQLGISTSHSASILGDYLKRHDHLYCFYSGPIPIVDELRLGYAPGAGLSQIAIFLAEMSEALLIPADRGRHLLRQSRALPEVIAVAIEDFDRKIERKKS